MGLAFKRYWSKYAMYLTVGLSHANILQIVIIDKYPICEGSGSSGTPAEAVRDWSIVRATTSPNFCATSLFLPSVSVADVAFA